MSSRSRRTVAEHLKTLGPGLITGASDDDPSGIATYSIAGASAGLSMLWLALLTTPMMAVIQGMCARIAMVTGEGLAANMKKSVPKPVAYGIGAAVIIANTINVGADFGGMGAAAHLIVPRISTPIWVVLFAAALLLATLYLSYRKICRTIKWLTISLFAYVITAFVVHPNWGFVLKNVITPQLHLQRAWLTTFMGVIGTTITPYLFFWQASLEVEEEKSMGRSTVAQRRGATEDEIVDAHFDVNTGMIFSNLIMAFIIITTGLTLFVHGKTNIGTAQDAALALVPLAGKFAGLLFTIGIVGTGLLAIPALAGSSAYVVSEFLGLRMEGLNEPPGRARHFYAVFGGGLVAGVAMVFAGVDPITGLYYSAVLNGLVSVPLVLLVLRMASNRQLMGKWRSSLVARAWAWLTFIVMTAAAVAMFAV